MKKSLILLSALISTAYANAQNLQQDTTVKSAKYSVHCYFGGEVVLTTEAKSATFNGSWKIYDIEGNVYETNAMCIVKTNG